MKKVIMFVSLILVALIGFKINTKAYDLSSGNLGYTYVDIMEYEERYTNDVETSYKGLFYSTVISDYITLDSMFSYLDNVEATNRMYIVPFDLQNNWYFQNNGVVPYDNLLYKLAYITFEYDILGSSASYMRLIDVNDQIFYSISLNGLNATSVFINNVPMSTNEEYWNGYDDGMSSGLIDGYNNGYANGINQSYQIGYDDGYLDGYDDGTAIDTDVRPLFQTLISFIGSVFMLTIFPGVTIGVLVSIPISFALFKWFMKMFGGK